VAYIDNLTGMAYKLKIYDNTSKYK